ncbi:hypothetical protein M378DRAFT_10832 [Amanita muscaria Koide BX008]|uniref:Uncharacterized protein n=1 Tax=Amanita muscaria (strain Koide BX008) TaxID=946122 RepID=A0A0C2WUJ3_AMAMK|nr:hypothetical protein M378DRAFT_10832 [Amanita muscaria Koide BX008]
MENLTKKEDPATPTSTKVKARFGTLPELKAAFQEEEAQRLEQERLNAEKEAQKTAETAARNARIATDTILRTIDSSLSAYKRKDLLDCSDKEVDDGTQTSQVLTLNPP